MDTTTLERNQSTNPPFRKRQKEERARLYQGLFCWARASVCSISLRASYRAFSSSIRFWRAVGSIVRVPCSDRVNLDTALLGAHTIIVVRTDPLWSFLCPERCERRAQSRHGR